MSITEMMQAGFAHHATQQVPSVSNDSCYHHCCHLQRMTA